MELRLSFCTCGCETKPRSAKARVSSSSGAGLCMSRTTVPRSIRSSSDLDVRARFLTGGPRFESDSRHRSDGGKRFASKAQSGDRKQILDVAELTSGVTLECEKRVVAHHSATIIGDANQSAPAAVD